MLLKVLILIPNLIKDPNSHSWFLYSKPIINEIHKKPFLILVNL